MDRKLLEISQDGQKIEDEFLDKLFQSNEKRVQLKLDDLAQLSSQETFDAIISNLSDYNSEQLLSIFKLLKPDGTLYVPAGNDSLRLQLKVVGYVVSQDQNYLTAKKPAYEIGSAVKIDSKGVWSLPVDDLDDEDLIDDDQLLDEEDRSKPTAESLRVCATTKQRKACATCSCGLKEELEQEEVDKIRENSQNAKSSCGNCYLGDAFRCASCPYRGMPAFKPGEKVTIDTTSDI